MTPLPARSDGPREMGEARNSEDNESPPQLDAWTVDDLYERLDQRLAPFSPGIDDFLRVCIGGPRSKSAAAQADLIRGALNAIDRQLGALAVEVPNELLARMGAVIVTDHADGIALRLQEWRTAISISAEETLRRELPSGSAYLFGHREGAAVRADVAEPTRVSKRGVVEAVTAFVERWWWFVGGVLAFLAAIASMTSPGPHPLWRSGLTLAGCLCVAWILWSAAAYLGGKVTDREPRDALNAGQFTMVLVGVAVANAVMCLFLAVAFFASLELAAAIDGSRHGDLKAATPWLVGIVTGFSALWAAITPFYLMAVWFGKRRSLQAMRDDALFTIAARSNPREGPSP